METRPLKDLLLFMLLIDTPRPSPRAIPNRHVRAASRQVEFVVIAWMRLLMWLRDLSKRANDAEVKRPVDGQTKEKLRPGGNSSALSQPRRGGAGFEPATFGL